MAWIVTPALRWLSFWRNWPSKDERSFALFTSRLPNCSRSLTWFTYSPLGSACTKAPPIKSFPFCSLSIYPAPSTTIQPITVSVWCGRYKRSALISYLSLVVIELACGEYGEDNLQRMVEGMSNGECVDWFADGTKVLKLEQLRQKFPISGPPREGELGQSNTTQWMQLKTLLKRGIIRGKRDTTLTHLRIGVNIAIALMLGLLFVNAGNEGSRVLDNYNLLFANLMHHSMTTMMLTVLTCKYGC